MCVDRFGAPHEAPACAVPTALAVWAASTPSSFSVSATVVGDAGLQCQFDANAMRTTVWGDGSASSQQVGGLFLISLLVPVSAVHPLHARMPAQQLGAMSGSFGDTIVGTRALRQR